MRDSYNGITPAFQAENEGSIPLSRSTQFGLLVKWDNTGFASRD